MSSRSRQSSRILAYIAATVAVTLWGMSYIWTDKIINQGVSIFYFIFVRIFLAGVIMFLFNTTYGRIKRIQKRDLPKFLLLAFFEPFTYFICETFGIKLTGSPTISAVVIATIPIFSTGAGVLFFKEKITPVNILGIIVSLTGILMVAAAKGAAGENFIWGIMLLLIAVLSTVGHSSLTKSLVGIYSSQIIVMYQFLIGAVYLLPLFLWKGHSDFNAEIYFSSEVWYPLICLTVLCSSLAFSLWVSSIKSLGVAKSSIFSAMIPVAAALVAWILGHELLTTRQWAGIAISTAGVVLSQYTAKKQVKTRV